MKNSVGFYLVFILALVCLLDIPIFVLNCKTENARRFRDLVHSFFAFFFHNKVLNISVMRMLPVRSKVFSRILGNKFENILLLFFSFMYVHILPFSGDGVEVKGGGAVFLTVYLSLSLGKGVWFSVYLFGFHL